MKALVIGLLCAVMYSIGFFVGRRSYIKYGDHSLINQAQQDGESATTDYGFDDRPTYRQGGVRVAG